MCRIVKRTLKRNKLKIFRDREKTKLKNYKTNFSLAIQFNM